DDDTREQAALIRRWAAERFVVELGAWNEGPRGPHVTPSFMLGFARELFPVIVPWLMLNSLGLTLFIHPNTVDARADHLEHAMWINRTQPVDGSRLQDDGTVEQVRPNTTPTV